jgi:hypothetical protein
MSSTGKQSLLVDTPVPTHKPFVDALLKSTGRLSCIDKNQRAASHAEALRLNGPGSPISVTLGVARRYEMFTRNLYVTFKEITLAVPILF